MTNQPTAKSPQMGERTLRNTEAMLSYCKANSFVVFDRESTHFQPNEHYGKIIELSAIKIVDGIQIDVLDMLINPEMKISAKITELTGIDNEMVKDAPTYKQALPKFIKFCEGSIIVAHNAMTDIKFVNYFSSKLGMPFDPRYIDTINLCKYLDQINHVTHEGSFKYNLKDIAERYGIENQNHHRAMNDTRATVKLFVKLKELLKDEIEKREYHESQILDLDYQSDVRIGKISYWEKEFGNNCYHRIYVRLIMKDKVAEIYYDFNQKLWQIKNAEFKTPGYEEMTRLLMNYLNTNDIARVYDITTYKKG